ncbi:MAG: DUF3868 domain-containing protein [Prevotellaceae bacterium]|nr:DUF3868 domain-containing protein [Prevotellaceae bacterium]
MKKITYIPVFLSLLLLAQAALAQRASLSFADTRIAVEMGDLTRSKQQMQVTMTLDLGALALPATRRIVLTPAVKNHEETRYLPAVVVYGRKQYIDYLRKGDKTIDDKATVVRRHNGKEQTVRYTATLPYEPWMENADVVLLQDVCGCGDLIGSESLPLWRWRHPAVAYIHPAGSVKTRTLEGSAHIDFPVDETTLYPDYGRNPEELSRVLRTIEKTNHDDRVTITHIAICGWASPESSYEHNAYLAEARAEALKRYVSGLLHLDDALFSVSFVPENWSGLRRLVQASTLTHRTAILQIIDDDTLDPDAKESKIKAAYPQDYAFMLGRFYPDLRRSDYTVTYTVRPFTVQEALTLWRRDPHLLSLEELYLVAWYYEPGSTEFEEVVATTVRLFPNDTVANLNAACAAITRGACEEAESYLSKAGDTPQAWNARGVVAAGLGDLERAAALFRQAAAMGLDVARDNFRLVGETY